MKNNRLKNAKAITLIALVVTIIVLLILAGVSVMMLTGDNGILTNAQQTSTQSAYKGAEEQVKIAYMAVKTEIMAKIIEDGTYDPTESEETTRLAGIVEKDLGITSGNTNGTWSVDSSEAGKIKITYTDSKIDQGVIGTASLLTPNGNSETIAIPRNEGVVYFQINLLPTQDAKLYVDTAPSGGSVTPATPDPVAQTYIVTYLANTGTGSMDEGTKNHGVDYTIASNEFTAPSGKVFKGWNTSADGTGTNYSAGATYSTDEDLILYAIWKNPVIAFRSYGEPDATDSVAGTYGTIGTRVFLVTGSTAENPATITVGSGTIQDNWKVFYEDDSFVYLIYGDYYPVNVQTAVDTIQLTPNSSYAYGVNDSTSRVNLLKYLRNYSKYTWSSRNDNFASGGTQYASWSNLQTALSGLTSLSGKTITIQGSPDIDLWVKSWNAKGNTELKTPKMANGYNIMGASESSNSNYYINVSTDDKYNTTKNETNHTGYYDTLYFPYTTSQTTATGYWLASPGGTNYSRVCFVACAGSVGCNGDYYHFALCARPVVSIEK